MCSLSEWITSVQQNIKLNAVFIIWCRNATSGQEGRKKRRKEHVQAISKSCQTSELRSVYSSKQVKNAQILLVLVELLESFYFKTVTT